MGCRNAFRVCFSRDIAGDCTGETVCEGGGDGWIVDNSPCLLLDCLRFNGSHSRKETISFGTARRIQAIASYSKAGLDWQCARAAPHTDFLQVGGMRGADALRHVSLLMATTA